MKSLKQIKEEYAIYHSYCDWNELIYSNDDPDYIDKCNDEVSKIHAKEVAKQSLINASNEIDPENCFRYSSERCTHDTVCEEILNESNIPEL